jgi:hypothetical protein
MNATPKWQTPYRGRHLSADDYDAADRAEDAARRRRRFDRICGAFGLAALAYFLIRCMV